MMHIGGATEMELGYPRYSAIILPRHKCYTTRFLTLLQMYIMHFYDS